MLLAGVLVCCAAAGASAEWRGKPLEAMSVASGGQTSCAISEGGQVWCWGSDAWGVIKNGPEPDLPPTRIRGISAALDVSTDGVAACAVTASRRVVCWGSNAWGQLGSSTDSGLKGPALVAGLSDIREVAVGRAKACALTMSGEVSCWGESPPAPVPGLSDATDLVAGDHICAVRESGQAVCWAGDNYFGEIGDGNRNDPLAPGMSYSSPTDVIGLLDATMVSIGSFSTCSVRVNGEAVCWGDNGEGQLGDGTDEMRLTPVRVGGLSGVGEIDISGTHGCAIVGTGRVSCWGDNRFGQLGDGSRTASRIPVHVGGLEAVTDISLEYGRSCATSHGRVWCWGMRADDFDYKQNGVDLKPTLVRRALPARASRLVVSPARTSVTRGSVRTFAVLVRNTGDLGVKRFRICLKVPPKVIASRCRLISGLDAREKRRKGFQVRFTRELPPGKVVTLRFRVEGTEIRGSGGRAKVFVRTRR